MTLNNLLYKILRLQQWIVNHPRTSSSYMALFTSIIIASFVILISTPSNINNSALKLQLAQAQTQLQPPSLSLQAPSNATTSTLALSNAQPTATTTANATTANVSANIDNTNNNAAAVNNIVPNATTKVITAKNKDSLARILQRLKLDPKNAKVILALNSAKALQSLKSGQKLNFAFTSDQKLNQITYQIDQLNTLVVTARGNNKFQAKIDHIEPTTNISFITTTVNGSIYSSAKKAGISGKMMAQIANIFNEKINLTKLRNGDKITILRKDYYLKDKKIKDGELAIVEIISKGKSYKAIAYTDPTGHTDFYTPEGYTLKSAFVRYPFKFKYISSPFSLRRYQPLLHIYREHTGVDLVGERGTPIKATSNGVIAFAGVDGGYGNVIILKHNQYSTKYAHLQGFAKQIHRGSAVRQGQVIGYLGSSGLATGPHVHFEFRINDAPVDPAKIKLPVGEMIAGNYRGKFLSQAKVMLAQLNTKKHMYAANTNAQQTANSKS